VTSPPTLADIRAAADRIAGKVHRTPLWRSTRIGDMIGAELHLKCESFQKTGSFKARGALNKILTLSDEERAAGLITVSAGNHAGAVAWAAHLVGAPCAVVMPTAAPQSKIDAVRGYGAEVILHPDRATVFDKLEAEREARGSTFVHPFDDPVVLAGAGTTGLEILEELPDVDVVVVPLGGGGIMGGVAIAVKALRPQVKVVAVELEDGPGMQPALDAGEPVPVTRPDTLADGMTPPFVGALPLAIARDKVDQLIGVSETEMLHAMRLLLTRCKLYVEASGAAATAALLAGKVSFDPSAKVVALVSGGNIDVEKFAAALAPITGA
jgi:threonine dehydratase